ncbi:basic amino acid/polyamine antiporter [Arthrobacter jiangjiafuii]|uniref:Basic amino acid/polyamine antiporter n=1 Tax=Arthrobacter jiangjiafuii TaxID=2817475 RepID=A0A975M6U0_9MICC|nr:basic amino acid/polyamine antiporter [Arthrobacter jiangjiafuii]MBP3043702.1 amino acid permease [Arthrobacter jiangjiafuii]QWC10734.1 basic amino acid/polyamine antiporter [Arthrobacter jiangjiafuii]
MSNPPASGEKAPAAKLSLLTLTTVVVGSMVGAGVFSLPQRFAEETGVSGALVAWLIAGSGMLMLAFVFQRLSMRKPDLDAGIFSYAKAGFGNYVGFFSAAGYWASACVGNVTYWVLTMSTLGALFPQLGAGDTLLAVVLSSAGLWGFFFLIRRGIKEATAINRIVTIAKVVPILVFVLFAVFLFDPAVFAGNLTGADYTGPLFEQVSNTMLVTVFVFLGVEGASVYSRHARRREDVGRATVLGFLSVFAIFASVTIVSYGVLPMEQLAELRQPSMAGVLESGVGTWGLVFVSAGLIISVMGAYLAWSLMAAEVLYVAAREKDMPRFLSRVSDDDVPVNALLLSTLLSQLVMVITYFSEDAFDFALDMTAVLTLFSLLFAALYGLKLGWSGETYEGAPSRIRRGDLTIAVIAVIYSVFLVYAAGLPLVLLSMIFYAPATVLFVIARREQGQRVFRGGELVLFLITLAGAVAGVLALTRGWIEL